MTRYLLAVAIAALGATAMAAETPRAKAPEPYAPGLGDFMTAYVQPHHIKLWEAGSAGNWSLAAYEANELRETFEDVTTYQAAWHDLPIVKMVATNLEPHLGAVDDAIAKHDADGFRKAYGALTDGCNQCHRAARHEFIIVQVPRGPAYPDQSFSAR